MEDLLFVIGCLFIVIGVAFWSMPAAIIVAGGALIAVSLIISRKKAHDELP